MIRFASLVILFTCVVDRHPVSSISNEKANTIYNEDNLPVYNVQHNPTLHIMKVLLNKGGVGVSPENVLDLDIKQSVDNSQDRPDIFERLFAYHGNGDDDVMHKKVLVC